MDAQLQDRIDMAPGSQFQFFKRLAVPGVKDERLFAYGVGPDAKGKTHVRVVEIVGRADRNVMDALILVFAPQLFHMAVEALEFAKIAHVIGKTVEYAHRIVGIACRDKGVSGVLDCLQVPRGDVTSRAD